MSKAVVNDEIVLMRKTVRQGKVHVIRKLVREIRTLKSKKPPADGSKKYTEKAERLYEELIIIKKINCDDISKYALTATVDPQKMLSKTDISIKDKALNRLAAHKFISDKVKSIKEKHNINDNIEKFLEPGKKKLRKLKHIEGKAKKKQLKLENASAATLNAKRQEWLEKQKLNEGAISENTIERLDKEIVNNKQFISKKNKSQNIGKQFSTETNKIDEREIKCGNEIKIEVEGNGNEIEENENDIEVEEDVENEIEEDDSEIEENSENNFDERNSTEQSGEESENETLSEMEQDNDDDINKTENGINDAVTTVDDFFLTDSGSHYESTFIPKNNVEVQTHMDGLNRQQRRAQIYGNTIKKRAKKFRNDRPNTKDDKTFVKQKVVKPPSRFNKPFTNSVKIDNPSNISRKIIKEKKEIINETSKPVSLHPSWEAKKKQKPQITAFQGKKIVFDD